MEVFSQIKLDREVKGMKVEIDINLRRWFIGYWMLGSSWSRKRKHAFYLGPFSFCITLGGKADE